MEYFVYYGKVNPDNYDQYPTHVLKQFSSKDVVLRLYKEFQEGLRDDDDEVIFKVFEGKELSIKEKKIVTDWDLE